MRKFIDQLYLALEGPLPGEAAQNRMSKIYRSHSLDKRTATARKAGVMALFYPKNKEWNLVFIERVKNKKDRHSGQISFPGGSFDQEDITFVRTAVRETEEEIGVPGEQINVLGELSPLYIPISNFLVHPFVGYVDFTPEFRPEIKEVHSILEAPFAPFLDRNAISTTHIQLPNNLVLNDVPHFEVKKKVIWGATAMMMNELIEVVKGQASPS